MGNLCAPCFNGAKKQQQLENDRLASAEARAKAAEAAIKRKQQFDNSPAGRAARTQQQKLASQAKHQNMGEPVLKWQMG